MQLFNRLLIILFIVANSVLFAQNKTIYAKYFVKQNSVLLRWVPANKQVFEMGAKNGYKITRYIKENNGLTSPIVLTENFKPLAFTDTLSWAYLLQKNSNGIIAYSFFSNLNKPKKTLTKQEAMNDDMQYGLLLLSCDFDAPLAKATGLFFTDSTSQNTKTYVYKIELNTTTPTTTNSPCWLDVNSSILSTNPPIQNLKAVVKNKHVKLKWSYAELKANYGSYQVERSTDSISFSKINTSPVILVSSQFEKKKDLITFDDTLPTTKVKYYYYIKGINYFGEESNPSNCLSVIGYKELKSFPIIDSIKTIANQKVFVKWRMKDETENDLVKTYILLRSKKDKGTYSTIHQSNNAGTYLDDKPEASNYYKIAAISYGNDTAYSYSSLALIIDSIPPSNPIGLKAIVDSKGNVVLTWTKNPEKDIKGYKVFKANALSEEFVQMKNEFITTTEFKDKLNLKTLSKKIFYKVVATDNNYNNSDFSEYIEVKRPDTIPPIAPLISDLKLLQHGIKITWIPSNSEDAKLYVLYHINTKGNTDIKVIEWLAKDSLKTFTDTTLELGESYRFKIVVTDDDDNINISNYPFMKFETGYRKKITTLNTTVNREDKLITLKWDYTTTEIEKFIIYRAKNQEQLTIIKTLDGSIKTYNDKELSINNFYTYRIKAVLKDGTESIISDELKAEY